MLYGNTCRPIVQVFHINRTNRKIYICYKKLADLVVEAEKSQDFQLEAGNLAELMI